MSDKQKKRYYWLKLKEDFFEEDTIEWLEEQPNGKEYCLFYLKLCLKSLKTEGILVRNVGNMMIPYDPESLAKLTNSNTDTVKVAMDLFNKIGLIKILDSGEIYLNQLSELVGSETEYARQKRIQRAKEDNVQKLSGKGRLEIEKDIDIDIDIDEGTNQIINRYLRINQYPIDEKRNTPIDEKVKDNNTSINNTFNNTKEYIRELPPSKKSKATPTRHKYGEYKNVLLSDEQMEKLKTEFPNDYQERIERLSEYCASTGKTYKNYLATIRNWAKKDNQPKKVSSGFNRNVRREKLPDWAKNNSIPTASSNELDPDVPF